VGKPTKSIGAGIARKARWAGNMVIDVFIAAVFFVGALMVSAVVLWVLTGEDDDV